MTTVKVMIFNKTEGLFFHLVNKWNEIGSCACQLRGLFYAALSGGKSPQPFFAQLSQNKEINFWDKTHIFMVDERFISPFHKDSNQRMVREKLINKINIPLKNFHSIPIRNTVFQSAREYEQELKYSFKLRKDEWPVFDLVLLGIGKDGHTASLFPYNRNLADMKNLITAESVPHLNYQRISLTLPVINHSRNIIFLVTGKEKASIVYQILIKKSKKLPAAWVQPEKGILYFFLDKSAGSLLTLNKNFVIS